MGFKRTFGKVISNFNPLRFMGMNTIKENTHFIKGLYKDGIMGKAPSVISKDATFEDLMQASGINEADLKARVASSQRFLVLGLVFLLALVVYAIYLFTGGQLFSGVVTLLMSVLMCTYAWREHFIMTQIKHRRVTMTVSEWFDLTIKRNPHV